MIRLNSAGRSFLVGTEVGSLLLRYAASRPADAPADPVALHVFNERGESENVIVAVTPTLELIAEVTDEDFGPEPDNGEATRFLRSRLDSGARPPVVEEPAATAAAPSEPLDSALQPEGS
ncbi:MAG: hypothetical protein M3116_01800 [Actinomycetota bacterium]|nr:hypothetical protein [Actinomycetota bacterium]